MSVNTVFCTLADLYVWVANISVPCPLSNHAIMTGHGRWEQRNQLLKIRFREFCCRLLCTILNKLKQRVVISRPALKCFLSYLSNRKGFNWYISTVEIRCSITQELMSLRQKYFFHIISPGSSQRMIKVLLLLATETVFQLWFSLLAMSQPCVVLKGWLGQPVPTLHLIGPGWVKITSYFAILL